MPAGIGNTSHQISGTFGSGRNEFAILPGGWVLGIEIALRRVRRRGVVEDIFRHGVAVRIYHGVVRTKQLCDLEGIDVDVKRVRNQRTVSLIHDLPFLDGIEGHRDRRIAVFKLVAVDGVRLAFPRRG